MTRRPTVCGLRIGVPFSLYGWRLRRRLGEELLAGAGIAIGVALLFSVLVASTGATRSGAQAIRAVVGNAKLELAARSPAGFDQRLGRSVANLPGVSHWGEVLLQNVLIAGPHGRVPAQLAGISGGIVTLGGVAHTAAEDGALSLAGEGAGDSEGVALPANLAAAIGVGRGQEVTVLARGIPHRTRVASVLDGARYSTLSASPVVLARLIAAQQLTGRQGRVTQILIEPDTSTGAHGQARLTHKLRRLAAGRLDVVGADHEIALLEEAFRPGQLATNMFALISAMVGFLLAVSAVLMTVPERRRFVTELRVLGYGAGQVAAILVLQALALGVVSSAAGVGLGYLISRALLDQAPTYLAFTFPVSSVGSVATATVALAFAAGLVAALLASLPPLLDLRASRTLEQAIRERQETGQRIPRGVTVALAVLALALAGTATALALIDPSESTLSGVLLALASACAIPAACRLTLGLLMPLAERSRGMLSLSLIELDATATRAAALAGIAALVMYGTISVNGSRIDLVHGTEATIAQYENTAAVWVTTGDNVFDADAFDAPGLTAALARLPAVAAVRPYQGGLLDLGDHRVLIRAHEPRAPAMVSSLTVLHGGYARANALLREGGWATISAGLARELHLRIGGPVTLPTPSGALRLRLAATTTNMGWPPGLISLSSADYSRGWLTTEPSALEVDLRPGTAPSAGLRAVGALLAASAPALRAQRAGERESEADRQMRQGVANLSRISTLISITGALAIAASLSAAIWQRRVRLASMRTWGYDRLQLWRSVLIESAIPLLVGCLTGAVLGIDGHIIGTRFLRMNQDFPTVFSLGLGQVVLSLTLVAAITLAVLALPGAGAARVAPTAAFQE